MRTLPISERALEGVFQLMIRLIVGTVFGYAGAFLGTLVNAAALPPNQLDTLFFGALRIVVIGVFAALVAQMGWIKIFASRSAAFLIWVGSAAIGALGVSVALAIGAAVLENSDLYMLNREISGLGLLGGALGCNLVPLVAAAVSILNEND